jgi:ATP-binding cassette, subfamily B, bacterial
MSDTSTVTHSSTDIPTTPVGFVLFVTRPYVFFAVAATLAASLAAGMSQSATIFFKWFTEAVEQGDTARAVWLGVAYPLVLLSIQLTYRISGWMGMFWVTKTQKESTSVLFDYVTLQSHQYFVNRFAGSLLNKVGNVVGAVDSLISGFLWSHLHAAVTFTVTFVLLLTVDRNAGLYFGLLVVLLLTLNYRWMPKKRELSKLNAAAGTKLRGSVVDVFANISVVRQYTGLGYERHRHEELAMTWIQARRRNWMHTERTLACNALLLAAFGVIIFYTLIMRWEVQQISTGDFLFSLALITNLSGTLIFIGRAMADTARAVGEAEEGLSELLQPLEIADADSAATLTIASGTIAWQNVTFRYDSHTIFEDFNLTIAPGQRLGLVGPSGAGKTTFVSLLLRQHELTDGAITIDNQNIATVTQDSLRQAIAVVPQEPALFHRTIRENIAYGKPDATDEEIIEVAKKAQAHDFISALPEGYNTLVGERGVKLSGGQKQRVAIARAMLKDAPILVLDEATSALDSESEVAIQKALHTLMAGKTVIAIAHRLSTLREMDRIIVLEAGKIIEDGTHETLKDYGGTYQRLWDHQAGGFLVE